MYGKANCSYTVVLDSQAVDIPPYLLDDLLFYQEDLTGTTHSIQVTAQPESDSTQQLIFDQAVVTNTAEQE